MHFVQKPLSLPSASIPEAPVAIVFTSSETRNGSSPKPSSKRPLKGFTRRSCIAVVAAALKLLMVSRKSQVYRFSVPITCPTFFTRSLFHDCPRAIIAGKSVDTP